MNVRHQYETWPFPGVNILSREGLLLLTNLRKCLMGGKTGSGRDPVVIDVGCGTGDTVVALAKHFPRHRFLGVDFSRASLRSAEQLRERHNLQNVEFRPVDLRRRVERLGTFRIVLCTGVLHHIRPPVAAFQRVASLVEPGGYLFVWMYGTYGRSPHRLNQGLLNLLAGKLSQEKRVRLAREFVRSMEPHVSGTGFYTPRGSGREGVQWLLDHPGWLVDQMLPAYENTVTMADILSLFRKNDLTFVKWLGGPEKMSAYSSSAMIDGAFRRLSRENRLIALDHLIRPSYYFVIGRRSRGGRRT